ncbi:ATPase [Hwanghaeella grinnelliae]|uniref:ATPase n=1 Tax=Hwanghaeella grinnelliae TaxID=2500179 RepID=A0A3S2VL14_9PROT|nr:ATP12 family protein [Hwanghaeella grinnelliae]RVU34676.1 ATPase [Hwanghaeella grinnelliae]
MKRFYKKAAAEPVAGMDGLYQVVLDGRPIKSPAKADLILPGKALAEAVADEWEAQGEKIQPAAMPLMTYVSTAVDRVEPQREAVAAEIASFAASDLLCYRADRQPDLVEKQEAAWTPMLQWAENRFGGSFTVTNGIMPVAQPNTTLMLVAREVGRLDSFQLTALHTMTTAMGSLILGFSVFDAHKTPDEAFELSLIDEDHQADLWGRDEEAEARRARLKEEVRSAQRLISLLGTA